MKFCAILDVKSAMSAVKRNGYALRYVKEQTEAVCLEAVKRNDYALQYVLEKKLFISIAGKFGISVTF